MRIWHDDVIGYANMHLASLSDIKQLSRQALAILLCIQLHFECVAAMYSAL